MRELGAKPGKVEIHSRPPIFGRARFHRKLHAIKITILVGALALLVAGCTSTPRRAYRANIDWPHFGNSTNNTRFSTLTQINDHNIRKLGIAWTLHEGTNLSLWETYPIVVGGTMYLTTVTDQVMAVDAATGKLRWEYTPIVNFLRAATVPGVELPVSRGVTYANGRLYLLTFDDQLIALHASNGKRLWRTVVADVGDGYSEPSPPTYWNGMLFVGSAGGDTGARGFVGAYDAKNGKQIWRFYTVPAPGHGWIPKTGHHGGGDIWMPPTIDAKAGILYLATGNPSPDLINLLRPGCNRWTDAVVALKARTGKFLWGHTQVCPDVWDYDSVQPPLIFNLKTHGRTIRVIGEGNKEGRYWIFDARTGKVRAESGGVVGIHHPVPRAHGVIVCPGEYGGYEYSPPAYSPLTRAIYAPAIQICMIYRTEPAGRVNRHPPGGPDLGGRLTALRPYRGVMAAIDSRTARFLWRDRMRAPLVGGALATAGNVVFSGCDDGHFYAFNARTGRILWSSRLGLPFGSAPITYRVNGTQYVAVAAGGSDVAVTENRRLGGTLVVFKLGGKAVSRSRAE